MNLRFLTLTLALTGAAGCADDGAPGDPCAVNVAEDGTTTLNCPGSAPVVIRDGVDGEACQSTDLGDGQYEIVCPNSEPVIVSDGANGEDGEQGPAGANGEDGAQGPAGANGEDGAQGPAGADGEDGAQGPAGADGENGAQGPAGADGEDGAQGPAGADGEDGAQGPAGADGEDGAQGPAGADGEDGAQGPAGADGNPCAVADNEDGTYTLTCPDGTSVVVSDGIDASDLVMAAVALDDGLDCIGGGFRLDFGVDDDADGRLDHAEIDGSTYMCQSGSLADAAHCFAFDGDGVNGRGNAAAAEFSGGTDFVEGIQGSAVVLDGVDGFVALPALDSPEDFSVAGWIYLEAEPARWSRFFELARNVDFPVSGSRFITLNDNNGGLAAREWHSDDFTTTETADALAVGAWHHLVYSYDQDGDGVSVYLDGLLIGQSAENDNGPDDWNADQALWLGRSFWSGDGDGEYVAARFDEVFLFDRAMRSGEVDALYANGLGTTCADVPALAD